MKGIIVLDEIPKSCVECSMCYHAEDMSIGQFKYERLYKCKLEPEDIEQVHLEDILHKKPDWCPIKEVPVTLEEIKSPHSMVDFQRKGFSRGWNSCIDAITGEK